MRIFPTLIIAALAYNYFAFMDPAFLNLHPFKLVLPSGMPLALTGADIIVAVGLFLLCIELIKSASSAKSTAVDHALSLLVFTGCLVEFIVVPIVGTPAFLLITIMTLIDVVAGFAVSLSSARRDMTLSA